MELLKLLVLRVLDIFVYNFLFGSRVPSTVLGYDAAKVVDFFFTD